jgi:hypothetical protein
MNTNVLVAKDSEALQKLSSAITRDGQNKFNKLSYSLFKQEAYRKHKYPGGMVTGYSISHVQ